jgi:Putative prokaryotic signal transducing protein
MTTVQTYGNLAEAGFAKSLLESAGIRAELADEHSYGLGYGPVVCELRLQVDEADLERARKVLAEGPDALASPAIESPSVDREDDLAPKGSRFPAGIFVAGGIAFLVLLFAVSQFREKQRQRDSTVHRYESDTNGDGKPDRFATYRRGVISSEIFDGNRDGKPDVWREYDSRGTPVRTTEDNNFDGRVDVWFDYQNGDLKSAQFDTDFNGVPDLTVEFKDQLPIRNIWKPNGSKNATRIEILVHGFRTEELVDSDGDGTMDYRIKYDAFANPSEHLPIEPGK